MRLKQFVLMVLILAFVSVALTTVFYSFYIVKEVKVVPMDVKVSDHSGFNLDTDAMHFGLVMSPGAVERSMIISHGSDEPLRVEIKTEGVMSEWVYPEEDSFVLWPNQSKEVMFDINVPENIEYGHYNGTIKIFFKKVI